MGRKLFLYFCIAVVAFFSLGYMVIPSKTISILGFNTNPDGLLIAQFVGVISMGYVVILWKMRDAALQEQKPILLGAATVMGLAFCVSLFHQLSGSFGKLGWLGVVNFGLGLLIFTFIAFGR